MEELTKFIASFEFATPLYYFGIGSTLLLLMIFFPWPRKGRGLAIDLQYWKPKVAFKSKRFLVLSILVAITSILMAGILSYPQVTARSITSIYGKPVTLVIDISGSMGHEESPEKEVLSGIEQARIVFYDLIGRRLDVNFSLLLYSTENYVARHFTYKNELFRDTLDNIEEIKYISKGTRIAEALAKARQFFVDNIEGKADKAIVLITDLEVDAWAMSKMVKEIERDILAGIKVYVIAIGEGKVAAYLATYQSQFEGLQMVYMYDRDGINQICKEISAMQISTVREEEVLSKKSLIPFLILPALGVITLSMILGETRLRKIP